MKLIQQAFYVPEVNKFYKSINTHDFTGHVFPDGREYFIDGGCDYTRTIGDFIRLPQEGKVVDFTLYADDDETLTYEITNKLLWGSRGKSGEYPLTFKLIKDLDVPHLQELIQYKYITPIYKATAQYWLNIKNEEN